MEDGKHRLAKRMRLAARIIGTVAAVFFVTMVIGSAVAEGVGPITIEAGTVVLLGVIALASCIASWWRDITGGILLVLTSIGFGVHIGCFAGRNHFLVWLMVGLPYLVAGALILSSWRLSRKPPQPEHTP